MCVLWGGGGGYLGLQRVWEVGHLHVECEHGLGVEKGGG